MSDKQPPILAVHPECCVIDCPEMAAPQGGLQATTVTISGHGLSLRVKAWIFTCTKHSQEFARIAEGASS